MQSAYLAHENSINSGPQRNRKRGYPEINRIASE